MSDSFESFVERIKLGFQSGLPGQKAQYQMVPEGRIKTNLNNTHKYNPREAGVLVLVYPVQNRPHLVLMQRNSYPGVHSDQISFPGGKKEEEDHNLISTALRESDEELGIKSNSVDVLGELTKVFIPPSNFLVQPVVGMAEKRPHFIPDASEVQEVVEVDIHQFSDPQNRQLVPMNLRGQMYDIPSFVINEKVIWGATAMMLSEFLTLTRTPF